MPVVVGQHRYCRYCRKELVARSGTIDHVIPRWAIRAFPFDLVRGDYVRFMNGNKVTACWSCNRRKGSMPAAQYVLLVLQPGRVVKKALAHWDQLAAEFSKLDCESARLHPRAPLVVEAFRRPIPPHFATRPVEIAPTGRRMVDYVTGR